MKQIYKKDILLTNTIKINILKKDFYISQYRKDYQFGGYLPNHVFENLNSHEYFL